MKYTRFEFKGGQHFELRQFIFMLIVMIPVIALISGLFISKLLIVPYLFKPEKNAEQVQYLLQDIKDRKFYIVQAGVYSSQNNAEQVVSKMRSDNLPAYINQEGQYYRILVHAGTDYGFAGKEISNYKASGYNCIIKELDLSAAKLPESLRSNKVYILLNKIVDYAGDEIETISGLLSKYNSKDADYDSIKDRLQGFHNEMSKLISEFKGTGSEDIQKYEELISKCEAIDNLLLEIISTDNGSGFYCKSQERVIQMIYMFYSIIEAYNNSIVM